MPWDQTARELLTATGFSPPASFYRLANDPKDLTEQVGRTFLGTRWQCAQCHNHPFERFRQIDYYGMAAMFARVRVTDEGVVPIERGEVTFPRTGKDALPAFPDGSPGDLLGDRRVKLAEWVASRPQFREAFANRVWAILMGRGIVHPADDFRASNPPSIPELLSELSRLETLPELVRAIAASAVYQRAGATDGNRKDLRFYSHAYSKPLEAEVLADAIARATGIEDSYEDRPAGTRAIDLGDFAAPSYTLDVCGRGRTGFDGSLAQELHLLNGEAIQKKLFGVKPLLLQDDGELVTELYLRAYSRFPSKRESEHWLRRLSDGPRDEVAEDLFWALLNSGEFMTCH
jgi:hypothetical protein